MGDKWVTGMLPRGFLSASPWTAEKLGPCAVHGLVQARADPHFNICPWLSLAGSHYRGVPTGYCGVDSTLGSSPTPPLNMASRRVGGWSHYPKQRWCHFSVLFPLAKLYPEIPAHTTRVAPAMACPRLCAGVPGSVQQGSAEAGSAWLDTTWVGVDT